jgi:hypothetical protein
MLFLKPTREGGHKMLQSKTRGEEIYKELEAVFTKMKQAYKSKNGNQLTILMVYLL